MQAHRAETTLSEDGVITLRDVLFRRGEAVEVIVLPFSAPAVSGVRYPLRGESLDTISFYEEAVGGLGRRFKDQVDRSVLGIATHPEL